MKPQYSTRVKKSNQIALPMSVLIADLSGLTSQGIAAYQSRGIVVAVGALRPHRSAAGRWRVVLLAAPAGEHLTAIQEISVTGRTHGTALAAAKERARTVAAKLGKGQTPGPARSVHLSLVPGSPVVRETAPAYSADPAACGHHHPSRHPGTGHERARRLRAGTHRRRL